MILLNKFRIRALDKVNIIFEEYKEVESKDKKTKRMDWVRVSGYYGSLDATLKALKDYIVQDSLSNEDSVDMLKVLDTLKESYVDTYIDFEQNDDLEVFGIIKKYRNTKQLQLTIPNDNEGDVAKLQTWLSKQQ